MKSSRNKKFFIKEIFEKYHKEIYKFIYFRSGNSKELAEDLTSEIFLKVIVNIEKFDPERSKIRTWLFKIARNHLIDYFRRKKVYKTNIEYANNIGHDDALIKTENDLLMNQILKSIYKLKSVQQELIFYRYMNDFTIKEISRITGLTESNVKVKLHRAIKKLKILVKQNG